MKRRRNNWASARWPISRPRSRPGTYNTTRAANTVSRLVLLSPTGLTLLPHAGVHDVDRPFPFPDALKASYELRTAHLIVPVLHLISHLHAVHHNMSATMTQVAKALLTPEAKAKRLVRILSINKTANKNVSKLTQQMLAQRNARPHASRSFRDKFLDIRKRRGVPTINIGALAACPPLKNQHIILLEGPSPVVETLPPSPMERRLPSFVQV